MSSPRTLVRRWRSRVTEAWRSTLSWMRWRRRRRLLLALERELFLELLQEQLPLLVQQETRALLVEALTPLAQALSRQDSLLLQETHRLSWQAETAEELLTELLQATQPSSRQQLEAALKSPT